MDVPSGVELGHKQGVPVPEFSLHQGPIELFKSQGNQFVLHGHDEFLVGVPAADVGSSRGLVYIEGPEGFGLPAPIGQHGGS